MDNNLWNIFELEKEIVVFGAGNIGKLVLEYSKLCHKRVTAVTDNNKKLYGKKIKRIKIMAPKETVKQYPNAIYIIANAKYSDDIKKQLISMNILEKNIEICSSQNAIQKKIYEKKHIKVIKENKCFIYDQEHYLTFEYIVKKIKASFLSVYYKMVMNVFRPQIKKKKYKVAICAIFQDEADYLEEWIEFHRIVGVDHFYLYNNFSKDNYLEILMPYIEKEIVTLSDWPIPQGQMSAYKDCVERYGCEANWIGFIDLDEFVVPNKYNNIYEFLKQFEKNRPLVLMYWKIFGTSGRKERDVKGFITEDFVVAGYKYTNIGKLFFNTNYTYAPELIPSGYMHYMWAKYKNINLPPVNVFDKVCLYNFNPISSREMPIQINHYLLKSYNEYINKKARRGGGVHKIGMHNMNYFYAHEELCQTLDYHAYKYLIQLKLSTTQKCKL